MSETTVIILVLRLRFSASLVLYSPSCLSKVRLFFACQSDSLEADDDGRQFMVKVRLCAGA